MPLPRKRYDTRREDFLVSVFWTVVFVGVFLGLTLLRQEPIAWYMAAMVVVLIGVHVRAVVWVIDWLFWLITDAGNDEDDEYQERK